ncbi:DUF2787 family protein [Shewanella sp. YIC-542]|uniref:DUF2787 family protein n=1 Tax=Shewanella mytili TaxID=3377111 RepID=UPI00398EFD22
MSDKQIVINAQPARRWLPVTRMLVAKLMALLAEKPPAASQTGVTLNFRDPDNSPESGGFHPVEIRIEPSPTNSYWHICYITDFGYFGRPYPELVKDIDFNFTTGQGYQAFVGIHPLRNFSGIYRIWEANFRSYLNNDTFQITITWD